MAGTIHEMSLLRRSTVPATNGRSWGLLDRFRIPSSVNPGEVYLDRIYVVNTPFGSLNLHRIYEPDSDTALHDHPATFRCLILRGGYEEERVRLVRPDRDHEYEWDHWVQAERTAPTRTRTAVHRPGTVNTIRTDEAHRITRLFRVPTWTLCLVGPRERVWGFWTEEGFVPYKEFQDQTRAYSGKGWSPITHPRVKVEERDRAALASDEYVEEILDDRPQRSITGLVRPPRMVVHAQNEGGDAYCGIALVDGAEGLMASTSTADVTCPGCLTALIAPHQQVSCREVGVVDAEGNPRGKIRVLVPSDMDDEEPPEPSGAPAPEGDLYVHGTETMDPSMTLCGRPAHYVTSGEIPLLANRWDDITCPECVATGGPEGTPSVSILDLTLRADPPPQDARPGRTRREIEDLHRFRTAMDMAEVEIGITDEMLLAVLRQYRALVNEDRRR